MNEHMTGKKDQGKRKKNETNHANNEAIYIGGSVDAVETQVIQRAITTTTSPGLNWWTKHKENVKQKGTQLKNSANFACEFEIS